MTTQRRPGAKKAVARRVAGRKVATRRPAAGAKGAARPSSRRRPAKPRPPAVPVPEVFVTARRAPDVVEVPARSALGIGGLGGPEQESFGRSIGALFGVAYGLKFARKKRAKRRDFKVGPLEGRWWAEGATGPSELETAPRESWCWRLRIAVPEDVTEGEVAEAIAAAVAKRAGRLQGSAEAGRVTLERIPAARMGRILHVGPYSEEPGSFTRIRQALAAAGCRGGDAHLEIYLSDPMRTAPAKLKTALLLEAIG